MATVSTQLEAYIESIDLNNNTNNNNTTTVYAINTNTNNTAVTTNANMVQPNSTAVTTANMDTMPVLTLSDISMYTLPPPAMTVEDTHSAGAEVAVVQEESITLPREDIMRGEEKDTINL